MAKGTPLGDLYFSLGINDEGFAKKMAQFQQKFGKDISIKVKLDLDMTKVNELKSTIASIERMGLTKGVTLKQSEAGKNEAAKGLIQQQILQERLRREVEKTTAAHSNTETRIKKNTQALEFQNKSMLNLRQASLQLSNQFGTMFSIYAVERFIQKMATVTGEFELQHRSLQAILQDTGAADKIFAQIKTLSVESPFKFGDLISYTKQLAAFSVPAGELYETMKNLADVSAGLGVDMGRITLAFGQVKAASVLRGQELRQFTEAGIPLVAELAKKFTELEGKTISAGDVFEKISKRMVSFEMVKDIFDDMTSAGGKFYQMQEIQAATLAGKISNLSDAFDIALSDMGNSMSGFLKSSVDGITGLTRNWETLMKVVASVVAVYGTYRAAVILTNIVNKEAAAINLMVAASNGVFTKSLAAQFLWTERLQAIQAILNKTMLSNPYVLAAVAIVGLIAVIWTLHDSTTAQQAAQEKLNEINKEAENRKENLKSKTDSLIAVIRSETSTINEQIAAYRELNALKLSGFKGKSRGDIKNMTPEQVTAAVGESNDMASIVSLQNIYNEALKEQTRLEGEQAKVNKVSRSEAEKKLLIQQDVVKLASAQLYEAESIRAEAEFEKKPAKDKQVILQKQLDLLVEQKKQLESNGSEWGRFGAAILGTKYDLVALNTQIKDIEFRMQGVGSDAESKDQSYWQDIKKKAEEALSNIDSSVSGASKLKAEQKAIIDNANTKLKFYDITGKAERQAESKAEKALKIRISLIKSAYSEYQKIAEFQSKPSALASVKSEFKGVVPESATTFDLPSLLNAAVSSSSAKNTETGRSIMKEIAAGATDEAKNASEAIFAELNNQIETYKSKFEFFKQLTGGGVSETEAIGIAFGANSNGKVVPVQDFLLSQIQKAATQAKELPFALDFSSDKTLQEQIGERYKSMTDDLKKMIDSAEQYRQDKQKEGWMEYIKIVNTETPEGSGFGFNVSGIVAKMNNAITEINNSAAKAMLSASDEQDVFIQEYRDNSIAAEKEIADQKLKSLGSVYIKQELKNKQLWESYSNMSDASLSEMKKIFGELSEMQKDLLSGKGLGKIAKATKFEGSGVTPIISSLSDSKSMDDMITKVKYLNDQISLYDNQRATQSGILSGLTENQVASLKMFLAVLQNIIPSLEDAKKKAEQVRFEKWAKGAKEVTSAVKGISGGIKGFAEAFGIEFNETEEAAFALVDTLADSTDNVISAMVAASMAASAATSTTAIAANTAVVGSATVATTAIRTVETASVILAIISAAIQVATAIVNIFTASSKKRKEAAEKERQAQLSAYYGILDYNMELRKQYDLTQQIGETRLEWAKREAKALEVQKKANEDAQKGLLGFAAKDRNIAGLLSTISTRGGRDGSDASKATDFEQLYQGLAKLSAEGALSADGQKYYEAVKKAHDEGVDLIKLNDEFLESQKELFTGTSRSSILDSIIEGFKEGKRSAADFASTFEDLMSNAVMAALSLQFDEGINTWFEEFYKANADSVITPEESAALRESWNKKIEEDAKKYDAIKAATGIDPAALSQSTSSMTKSIQALTEDTGDRLGGYINAIRQDSASNSKTLKDISSFLLDNNDNIKNSTLYLYEMNNKVTEINTTTKEIRDALKSVITPVQGGNGFRMA